MVFVMRKLDQVTQNLGEKLRALRRGQAVSLEMMERHTHIQKHYLEALERGRFDELPEPLYSRNFIKAYCRYLGADETYFLELYVEESGRMDLLAPHRLPRQRVLQSWLFAPAKLLKTLSFSAIGLVMLTYFVWQINGVLRPPLVVIDSPNDGIEAKTALIVVRGHVESNDVSLVINGRPVVINTDDTFTTTVDLSRGLNIIKVEGVRRYSQKAVEIRHVVFSQTTAMSNLGISREQEVLK